MIRFICFLMIIQLTNAQDNNYKKEIKAFQNQLDEDYKNPETSPLSKNDIKKFRGHDYFKINKNYKVTAKFEIIEEPVTFLMKTSSSRLPEYNTYAKVTFVLDEKEYQLTVYKSLSSYDDPEYFNYLFFPFTDLTNGEESYTVGRYIDLKIPEGDTIVIDFNKSYNPYCAYSKNYSCPVPPEDNHLPIRIKAGIKKSNL